MFSAFAFLLVIRPLEVETIVMPSPLSTLGRSSAPAYWRKPGEDILPILVIAGCLVSLSYFRAIFIVAEGTSPSNL